MLFNIGTTPAALVQWLTNDPDFRIVSPPAATILGQGIKATRLIVGVSTTANYQNHQCQAAPRCADLFYNGFAGYGIAGTEETELYLASFVINGSPPDTLIVALDADDHSVLPALEMEAQPILNSLRLPAGATAS